MCGLTDVGGKNVKLPLTESCSHSITDTPTNSTTGSFLQLRQLSLCTFISTNPEVRSPYQERQNACSVAPYLPSTRTTRLQRVSSQRTTVNLCDQDQVAVCTRAGRWKEEKAGPWSQRFSCPKFILNVDVVHPKRMWENQSCKWVFYF